MADESPPSRKPQGGPPRYRVGIRRSQTKRLEKLPRAIRIQISEKIDALVLDPRPSGCEKLVDWTPTTWRVRVGDYRLLYTVDDDARDVMVLLIENRSDVYK